MAGETLPDFAYIRDVEGLRKALAASQEQRDDLLAACKRLVKAIGIPSSITIGDAVEQAEAAIARAEGEKG